MVLLKAIKITVTDIFIIFCTLKQIINIIIGQACDFYVGKHSFIFDYCELMRKYELSDFL